MATITVSENMPNIILNGSNLYEDYGLVPKERPIIKPPEIITNTVDVPGSVTGPIDMTYHLTPYNQYNDVSGTLEFYADLSKQNMDWRALYSALTQITRPNSTMMLTEDPDWVYVGNVSFSDMTSSNKGSLPTVKLNYIFRPWQTELIGTTVHIPNNSINLKQYVGETYTNTADIKVTATKANKTDDIYGVLEYTTLNGRTKTINIKHGVNIIPDLFARNDVNTFVKYTKRVDSELTINILRRRLYHV